MELDTALGFARQRRQGVLVTQRRDGRPQLSNVTYAIDGEGTVRVSTTADRAKARNLARVPVASLHVAREDFYAYVVLDGSAELSPVATAVDDAAVDELVDLYRAIAGEHPDWDDYRRAMVADRRLVARLRPTHAYGLLPAHTPA